MNIIIAIIILLGYTIALCIKGGGVPSSLSASVFDLPKSQRWIWTVMLYAVCSQLVLVFNQPWLLLCWIPWVATFFWLRQETTWKAVQWRTKVFWAEMVCFGSTFIFCLI